MPYLRRLILLLTLSTSILLVTLHLLHLSHRHHQQEPLYPVITKEQAEKDFSYLKQYDHPIKPEDLAIPNRDYANRIAYGKDPPTPPKKEDLIIPEQKDTKSEQKNSKPEQKDLNVEVKEESKPEQKDSKPEPKVDPKVKTKPNPTLDMAKVAPANATAWHKDKNLWKVVDALHG